MEVSDYIALDDRMLVTRSLEGDEKAFEHLFTRYREAIRQLLQQRAGSADDADDQVLML